MKLAVIRSAILSSVCCLLSGCLTEKVVKLENRVANSGPDRSVLTSAIKKAYIFDAQSLAKLNEHLHLEIEVANSVDGHTARYIACIDNPQKVIRKTSMKHGPNDWGVTHTAQVKKYRRTAEHSIIRQVPVLRVNHVHNHSLPPNTKEAVLFTSNKGQIASISYRASQAIISEHRGELQRLATKYSDEITIGDWQIYRKRKYKRNIKSLGIFLSPFTIPVDVIHSLAK